MPPNKGKGKGKGKVKAESSGSSSSEHKPQQKPSTHIFLVFLDELRPTYEATMESIPRALRKLLLARALRKTNKKTRLRRVHKKHYTIEEGTFMIRIQPSKNSPPEQHLTLLFRWMDLYYVAYHCRDVWYIFDDTLKQDPPPQSQLFYRNRKNGGIVNLPFGTSYDDLGGFTIFLGPQSFWNLYDTLMQTPVFKQQNCLNRLFQHCQMSLPAVAFSEASRFGQFFEWVLSQTSLDSNHIGEDKTPEEYSMHFHSWQVDSEAMFNTKDGNPPADIASRMRILKTPTRHVTIPIIRGPHEMAATASSEEEVEEV